MEEDFDKLKKMQEDFGRVATHQDKDEEEVRKLKAENARFENEVKNFREVNLCFICNCGIDTLSAFFCVASCPPSQSEASRREKGLDGVQ